MAISEKGRPNDYNYVEDEDDYSESGGSDLGNDSDPDPSYSILEETNANFSNLSIKKKSKSCIIKDPEEVEDVGVELDEKSFEEVQKIIEAGNLEKLKVEKCKVYLRKNGLRLTGNKEILIQRIKEHQEILNGGGEKKYPVSSFVLNCKGDACTGDVVMFEQNVYEMFSIASRSATGPPCGTRIVAGRIVKESYGAAKQQHTFTIEVLWSKGEKPLPPLHPLLIKGRNLYRLKTLRQRWEDEGERQKVLMDKHLRGSLARSDREIRIQKKERRNVLKANRVLKKDEPHKNQSQLNSTSTANSVIQSNQSGKPAIQFQQSGLPGYSGKVARGPKQPAFLTLPEQSGPCFVYVKPIAQPPQQSSVYLDTRKPAVQPFQQSSSSFGTGKPKPAIQDSNHDLSKMHIPVQEVQHYRQPSVSLNSYVSPSKKYPNIDQMSNSTERNYHRQPLRSMNCHRPMIPPQRQGQTKQLCRYYVQGRCYYGDNCKYLHKLREVCGQSGTEQREFKRWPY